MTTPSHKAKKEKKSKASASSTSAPALTASTSKSTSKSKSKSKSKPVQEEKVASTHDDDDDVRFDVDNDTDEPVVAMEEETLIEEDEQDEVSDEETPPPTITKPTSSTSTSTDIKHTKSDPFTLVIQLCRSLSTYTPTTPSSSLLTPLQTLHHISTHPSSHLILSSTNAKELQSIWKTIDASKPHDTSTILIQDAVASLPIDAAFLLTCLTRRLTSLIHSRLSIPPPTSSSSTFHDLYISFITDSFASEWETLRGDDGMDARRVDVLADGIRHGSDIYTTFEREMHIEGFRQALARKKRVKTQNNTPAAASASSSKSVPTNDKSDVTGEDLIEQEDEDTTQKLDKKSKKGKDGATKKKKKDKIATSTESATNENEEKSSKKHKATEQNGVEHKKSKKQKH